LVDDFELIGEPGAAFFLRFLCNRLYFFGSFLSDLLAINVEGPRVVLVVLSDYELGSGVVHIDFKGRVLN
jgi:hypothetical protein